MPNFTQTLRRAFHLAIAALAIGILISCATKKEKSSPSASAAAGDKKPPSSTPSPTPAPEPTPQARYTATVKVDGVDVAQNQVITPDGAATPSPTPGASPAPKVSPSPTPKPKANFLTGTWRKIFPPKPLPAPTPGETGGMTIRVSTAEGGAVQQVVRAATNNGPSAVPSPTPIQIKLRPSEGFLTRMWHRIFPKK